MFEKTKSFYLGGFQFVMSLKIWGVWHTLSMAYTVCHALIPIASEICRRNNYGVILMSKRVTEIKFCQSTKNISM